MTSIPYKILEAVIKDHVICYLENHELLSRDQHGFRHKRSCTSQFLEVLNEWSISLDESDTIDVIYLDFKKAFDSVPHQRLLSKLEHYGISGNLKLWIAFFLTGRSQRVVVRGCHSPWAPVLSGVNQGSVLVPVLFILYINDLPDSVQSSIKIFADDTKIYHTVSDNSGHRLLQQDLDAVVEWSKLWQLPFNELKCKSLHAGPGNPGHRNTMQGHIIETATEENDLWVSLDSNLKFRKQAAIAASKGNQMLAQLRRSFLSMDRITLSLFLQDSGKASPGVW